MKSDYKTYKIGDLVHSLGSACKTYGIIIELPSDRDCVHEMPENFYKVHWDQGYGAFWTHTENFILVVRA